MNIAVGSFPQFHFRAENQGPLESWLEAICSPTIESPAHVESFLDLTFQLKKVGVGVKHPEEDQIETGSLLCVFAGLEELRREVRKALKFIFGFDGHVQEVAHIDFQ